MPALSPAALADGRRFFDAARYEDRPHQASPWQPGDREAFARAYAQLATALPERRVEHDETVVPRPRKLAQVRPCVIAEIDRRVAGGRL